LTEDSQFPLANEEYGMVMDQSWNNGMTEQISDHTDQCERSYGLSYLPAPQAAGQQMVRVLLLLLLLLLFVKRRHFGPLEVCTIGLSTTGSSMVPSKERKNENKKVKQ
jgi:hypothetical protein